MHQRVLHILTYASDQVNVVDKQFFEKAPGDVSLVRHEFSEDLFRKLLVLQRGTIIRVGLRQLPLDDFSVVVDNDVQFETEEPPHSPFATCGKSPKGFVSSRSLVVTHPNGGGINDRDARAIAQTTVVEKQIKFERNHLLTFHNAIVREYDGKVLSPLFADHLGVESLECSVARKVKEDETGDNFAVAHLKSTISPLFSVFADRFFLELRFNLLTEFVDRIKDFRYLCSVNSVHME